MKEMMVDFYLRHVQESIVRYGPCTMVFVESGSFMEVYDHVSEEISPHLRVCAELLNIIVTRKDKSNPNSDYLAGIPTANIQRYQKLLVRQGYTVVMITQTTRPPAVIEREVTQILSPGCHLFEDDATIAALKLMSVVDDTWRCTFDPAAGSLVLELGSATDDASELILATLDGDGGGTETSRRLPDLVHRVRVPPHFLDRSFQIQFLQEIYPHHCTPYLTLHEALGIERCEAPAVAGLLLVLDFVRMHDKDLIKNLPRPVVSFFHVAETLSFHNEALEKLNVFGDQGLLRAVLDKTVTAPGSRLMELYVRNPLTCPKKIQERYDAVQVLLQVQQDDLGLARLLDYERVFRRVAIGRLPSHAILSIARSNAQVLEFFARLPPTLAPSWLPSWTEQETFRAFQARLAEIFWLEGGGGGERVFRQGFFPALDALVEKQEEHQAFFEKVRTHLESLGNGVVLSLRCTDRDGYFLELTPSRLKKLQEAVRDPAAGEMLLRETGLMVHDMVGVASSKTTARITFPCFRGRSNALQALQQESTELTNARYKEVLEELYGSFWEKGIEPCYQAVTRLDVLGTFARVARENRYCRPTFGDLGGGSSGLQAEALRHPLLERILEGKTYVANDLLLDRHHGKLLYGVNSVGKSSLLKSVALAIIMAQTGMFVAARSFCFVPFTRLFMRTGNQDNLFRHHSSFIREMSETREILEKADAQSLVLADEMCASTETESAVSIVAAVLVLLARRGSVFLFATHLFALQDHFLIQELLTSVLQNLHLEVRFQGELVFDRRLQEGLPERRDYGLLVASKVLAHPEFDRTVNHRPYQPVASVARSRYHRALFLEKCTVCQYRPEKSTDLPLDTHHIRMQCQADADGYFDQGARHKNEFENLVALCKPCHLRVHRGDLVIRGYLETDAGRILDFS